MKSHRPVFRLITNRFFKAFSEVFCVNLQPRNPTLGQKFHLVAFALLASCLAPALASAGTLSVTPTSASFGTVALGTKNSQAVLVKNTGITSLTISSVSLAGIGYSMSDLHIPRTLAAGEATTLTVSFAPVVSGSFAGSITFRSNASNPTVGVSLAGAGGAATRSLSLSTSTLSFGNETVGNTSTLGVTVKNTGNSSVTISQVTTSGGGFGIAGGFIGATIAAGQSATLNVVFSPQATGTSSGKLTISSNATNSPNSISASGTGVSNTAHSVSLSWSGGSSSGILGYYVYRSTVSGSAYLRVNLVPTASTKFTDGTVASGRTYYYVVTAVGGSGESPRSNQIVAVVP